MRHNFSKVPLYQMTHKQINKLLCACRVLLSTINASHQPVGRALVSLSESLLVGALAISKL